MSNNKLHYYLRHGVKVTDGKHIGELSKGEYVLVEVPKDAYKFITECFDNKNTKVSRTVLDFQRKSTPHRGTKLILYNGNYTFICTTDDISEEVAAIQSLNISPDKNYAICKQN
jgi:hypothetical protein